MLVFNLTNNPLVYRKRTIPPEGSFDFTDLDFIPDRDRALEKANIISFGTRPRSWISSQPQPLTAEAVVRLTKPPEVPELQVREAKTEERTEERVKVEEKVEVSFKKKRY